MDMEQFVRDATETYQRAVVVHETQVQRMQEEHEKQVLRMQKEYESLVHESMQKMEVLMSKPLEVVEDPAKGALVTKIQTDNGETHYVFNQQAMDVNTANIDAMIEILNEIK